MNASTRVWAAPWGLLVCAALLTACASDPKAPQETESDAAVVDVVDTGFNSSDAPSNDTFLDSTSSGKDALDDTSFVDVSPDITSDIPAPMPRCTHTSHPDGDVVLNGAVTLEARADAGAHCIWTLNAAQPAQIEITLLEGSGDLVLDERTEDEPGWIAPKLLSAGVHTLMLTATTPTTIAVRIQTYAPAPETLDHARSLVWTDAAILDNPEKVGLRRLIQTLHSDVSGGLLLVQWFRRFSTTPHSERLGPELLLEEVSQAQGDDPALWDLDTLPFTITAIHNRLDLADMGHCGEFRVSMASTHPLFQPFHIIFLYRQPPQPGDVSPGGRVHCAETGRRWAELSNLPHEDFLQTATQMLDAHLTPERLLLAESVEFTISPWEWRQWRVLPNPSPSPGLPVILDNPPLFQTVDTERLNEPGELRDMFLTWVASEADAIDQRRAILPEMFRNPSARVIAGIPWIALDLDGLEPAIEARLPNLRQHIEIAGCPACHATDAEFIHTLPDRTFSPFYIKELDAREQHLRERIMANAEPGPFGPLQPNPLLPP